MNAKELRIGNYGKEITHSTNRVVGVKKHHFEDIERGEIDLFPIPLTEEWLVKFGFEKLEGWDDMFYFQIGYFQIYEYNVSGYEYDGFDIKHVHQLQNLYFALTNEELKLK